LWFSFFFFFYFVFVFGVFTKASILPSNYYYYTARKAKVKFAGFPLIYFFVVALFVLFVLYALLWTVSDSIVKAMTSLAFDR